MFGDDVILHACGRAIVAYVPDIQCPGLSGWYGHVTMLEPRNLDDHTLVVSFREMVLVFAIAYPLPS